MLRRIATAMFILALANTWAGEGKEYRDPARWEKTIASFEKQARENPPPMGAIVCIGSSSMRGWHKTIRRDLAPLTVIPRGFGGSNYNDALHYVTRIVIPYKPRAVLVYEGDNDLAQGIAPEKVRDTARAFAEKIHRHLPETRIYFLPAKPSPSRWRLWPAMQRANALIEAMCRGDERLFYIDTASPMLSDDGKPRPEIFLDDNLHMNAGGYEIWTRTVRPVLVDREAKHERQ